ncbi:alpha/beta hydrolase [Actinocorallia populi]|uniref:alpha/beta hydrolase n=1 Tax=Actinocorallia populi TaxID=2079200 RepID=UPI001300B09C|nr:alpha/beta hydrolase [Actinocorallia populi]
MRVLLVTSAILVASVGWAGPAQAAPTVKMKTVSFGALKSQRMDVYAAPAKNKKKRPAILLIHGGYWWGGDKSHWKSFAKDLAGRGYVVFSANYRLSQQAVWPAQREDSEAAVKYIRKKAGKLGVNPKRIIAMGTSAGGQLASMLAVHGTGGSRVRAVVALSPVNSPMDGYEAGGRDGADYHTRRLRQAVIQLLGCTPVFQDPDCWPLLTDATPDEHVTEGDAPALIVHSAKEFVTAEQSQALRAEMRAADVPVTLRELPGDRHGAEILKNKKNYNQVLKWIAKWAR